MSLMELKSGELLLETRRESISSPFPAARGYLHSLARGPFIFKGISPTSASIITFLFDLDPLASISYSLLQFPWACPGNQK